MAPRSQDPHLLLLSELDNVLVLRRPAAAGAALMVEGEPVLSARALALGHKIARRPIRTGEKVIKYGVPIGAATADIAAGEHVHVHNMKSDYTRTHLIEKPA